jgi:hypothetical protein
MDVEILQFFPTEHDENKRIITGTLKVRIIGLGLLILGVFVQKRKDNWFFGMPNKKGVNPEGLLVSFPCIAFENPEQQRKLMAIIRERGITFIEKQIAENSLKFPPTQQRSQKPAIPPTSRESAVAQKQTLSINRSKPEQSVAEKNWMDPPPRKTSQKFVARSSPKEYNNSLKGR